LGLDVGELRRGEVNEMKRRDFDDGNGCANSEIDDIRRPVWLEATESFYKKLNRIAKSCQLSRYQALSKGLDALMREGEIRNSALNRNIKSPSQSEVFRRTMGQVSRNYWATVSEEERRERGRRNAQARWSRRLHFGIATQQEVSAGKHGE
jgi:hypothetical protein